MRCPTAPQPSPFLQGRLDWTSRLAIEAKAEALAESNRQLDMARTTAEEARAIADDANKAKANSLANMSHELRTPLNAINHAGLPLHSSSPNALNHHRSSSPADNR